MKLKSTLLAALLVGLWSTSPMAQHTSNPTGQDASGSTAAGSTAESSTMHRSGTASGAAPTDSSNPYKAHNSDMRTQTSGDRMGREPATGTTTNSPNPNKAQNSHMRTQAGSGTTGYAVDPQGNRILPAEPTASSRRSAGVGQTHSPNPNKSQNSGMKTQSGVGSTSASPASGGTTYSPNPNTSQNSEMKTQ